MSNAEPAWPAIEARGNYIRGHFVVPSSVDGVIRDVNPADASDVVAEFPYEIAAVDEAVASAREAFPAWSALPLSERASALRAYAEHLGRRKEELALCISREMGKVAWEARTEVGAMIAKVTVTLDDAMRLVADYQPPGVNGRIRYLPRGVMAVVGPFNFPGHLPNGHIVPALATGNTVVFKPASPTPGVGQIMAECFDAAGFPPGVFNLVQLPGRHGDRLVAHRDVDAVLFTGSTEVGMHIEQLALEQHWKLTALEMGGKNPAIVLADANFDQAVYEVLTGGFLTTGQRCTATSRIIVERPIADRFAEALAAAVRALRVGPQRGDDVFMGPMVDRRAAEEFAAWLPRAASEGAEVLVEGGLATEAPSGSAFVRPSLHRVQRADPESAYQRAELFGPDSCLYTVDSLEEAVALAEDTEYGLACSVFTQRESAFHEVVRRVRAGVINWNRATVGASGKLPFGGMKKSGNGHPAALFSVLYCTYPVASLENDKPFDRTTLLPGVRLSH